MKKLLIKYCGNKSFEDLQVVSSSKAEYIGVIFAESKRQVKIEQLRKWLAEVDIRNKQIVGVFVNAVPQEIKEITRQVPLSIVQCHGLETTQMLKDIKKVVKLPVWKAIHHDEYAIHTMQELDSIVDGYVIDSKVRGMWGGSGKSFDWSFVPLYTNEARRQGVPCLIAGGVNPTNIQDLLTYDIDGVDVSSGIEINFKKNHQQIESIEKQVKHYETSTRP